jgi:hypothetical protein
MDTEEKVELVFNLLLRKWMPFLQKFPSRLAQEQCVGDLAYHVSGWLSPDLGLFCVRTEHEASLSPLLSSSTS